MNSKLSTAIAAILGGVSFGAAAMASPADGPDVAATPAASSDTLQEITVTAQRRTESMQDVPISMQAFTGQTLQQLNIQTFDDYIKYLPNVTSANNGPGQNEVFMRGLSAGSQASQGSAATGLWPNVAIYLDNQSAQVPESQPRHLCRGPGPHRGAGRPARHAVRRRRRGRRHPLHHERAEARCDRRERQGRLRRHRPWRPECGRAGGDQPAADRRHDGGAGGHLRRPPWRLYQQRAGDVHAQGHGHRHPLRELRDRLFRRRADRRGLPGHQHGDCVRRARPAARRSTTATWSETPSTPSPTRESGPRRSTSSTRIGTCWSPSPTRR